MLPQDFSIFLLDHVALFLIMLISLTALTNSKETSKSILIFSSFLCVFGAAGSFIPDHAGWWYYVGSALTLDLIIYSLSQFCKPTITTVRLQTISLWLIYANLFGCLMYLGYYSHTLYNFVCWGLFVLALSNTLNRRNGSVLDINSRSFRYSSLFRGFNSSRIC